MTLTYKISEEYVKTQFNYVGNRCIVQGYITSWWPSVDKHRYKDVKLCKNRIW